MADNKKADGIADDKKQERVLYGIQPRRQKIYKFYKLLRLYFWFILAFSIIMIGVTFIQDSTVQSITGNKYYRYIAIGILGITLVILLILLFIKHILLRKCPFDDWVYDIAQKRVGTDVIFYDNKYLWIQYDRGNKEVDKKDFVIEMSDKSDKYSYFYIKTWIDEGVLQVETKKKTVIPDKASKNMEDDKYPNIIPVGLARDDVHQKISPIGWWINDNEKNKEMIMTSPSVSMLIVGGTGSGKSVMEQSIVAHASHYPDNFQIVGIDVKQVEFNLLRGVKSIKGVALTVATAAETITAFQQIMMSRFLFMKDNNVNNIYKLKDKKVKYYDLMLRHCQCDEIFEIQVKFDTTKGDRETEKLLKMYPDGIQPRIMTIENIYKGMKDGTIKDPVFPKVKGYNPNIKLEDITITEDIYKPKIMIFLADELNELMTSDDYKSVDQIKYCLGSIARLGRA